MSEISKLMLIIMDGWGIGKHDKSDAIFNARTPFIDGLYKNVPNTTLLTHGLNVGLPEGQMGNSEVGHMNIGAGRIVYQMLTRIDKEFEDEQVEELPEVKRILNKALNEQKKIHLIGLVSDGGVHSSIKHLILFCKLLQKYKLDDRSFIHAFTDGRDTDPYSGIRFFSELIPENIGQVKVASCIGRYYAMDRDKRWERVKKAYDLLTRGTGIKSDNCIKAIQNSYNSGITDEFIEPISIVDDQNNAIALIEEGDLVININFRTDRGREISMALTQTAFPEYDMAPLDVDYTTFTEYDKTFKNVHVLFKNTDLNNTLGEVISNAGLKQIRAAETEKYPHVTFFFSGGREAVFEGEKRILVPSPKVATYDLQPEMSAIELKNQILEQIEQGDADFMCINFANPDMVGHTGVYEAIVKAVETVDSCVGELVEAGRKKGYQFIIIADHGNADNAINEDGSPNTAHSVNPVPCFVIGKNDIELHDGILADIAPTVLKMMGLPPVAEMTGKPLF
ncbi:MAG: 2,3-bisphosphoglycerate-independent phosphoglycerate mutase [Flavobacteriales bacterium]|nr:2,3-bisphosphoglycerate-independent phosphoglycerate mutase [Flavobacteriales bacterium]